MVRHVQDPGLFSIVISPHKVVFGFLRHIRGGNRDVFVAGNIHALAVILLIIYPCRNGEPGNIPFAVIHHRMDVRRKNGLGVVIYRNRRVRPPEESLGHGSTVVKLPLDLNIRLSRIQGNPGNPLGAVHLVHIMEQDGSAAVLPFLHHIVHRKEGSGPMMLGPVELDPSGDPGPCQPHQRRLDHMVVIYEVIIVGLVIGPLNPAPQFGQHHHPQVFVFQPHGCVFLIPFLLADPLHGGVRVNLPAAALIHPLIQKNGVLLRLPDLIGGDHNFLLPDGCFLIHFLPPFRFLRFVKFFI